jgi:hypothetical protein
MTKAHKNLREWNAKQQTEESRRQSGVLLENKERLQDADEKLKVYINPLSYICTYIHTYIYIYTYIYMYI